MNTGNFIAPADARRARLPVGRRNVAVATGIATIEGGNISRHDPASPQAHCALYITQT
jgi:hypothetical protein